MSLSVVIPSKTASNLIPCAHAVRGHEPQAKIIIVDDGLDLSKADAASAGGCWACSLEPGPVLIVEGSKPFIYARNCNLGIRAADTDDVVLLNDDAVLHTPGGLSALQQSAEQHPEFGLIAATCNNVGNRNQWPRGIGLREDPRTVCFVAVLIPRRTFDLVGLLDEDYTGYGFEDDDFCYRVRRAGLKIGIHDGCFVDHGSLRSTFRGDPRNPADLNIGRRIFIQKHGVYPL